jgi:DeoR family deoxyribose operon repressor
MPSRKRQDRIARILDSLSSAGGASIRDLAAALDVSEMTIRRDLDLLSADGKVRLVHSGAIASVLSVEGVPRGYTLSDLRGPAAEEKMRIGQKAASLVEPGDVVIIDSGATTEWLARSIPPGLPVTILCFALNIALSCSREASCGKRHSSAKARKA